MKKIYFFFFLLFAVIVSAQNIDQQKIHDDSKDFIKHFGRKDYDGILNATYPLLFEKFNRDTLKELFKQMFEGNEDFAMDILTDANDIFKVSEIFTASDQSKYAFVTYPSKFKMTFKNLEMDDEQQKVMIEMMKSEGIDATFTDNKTIMAKKKGMMVALNDKFTKGAWKYLNHDEGNPMYSTLLSAEIMKKAKEYYQNSGK